MPEPLDLTDIRDRLRRARAAQEPYDAADQWAMLGGDVPDLLDEVVRLSEAARQLEAERDEAVARLEGSRQFIDTEVARLRRESNAQRLKVAALEGQLLDMQRQSIAARKVVGAAAEAREALAALLESVDATRPGVNLPETEPAKRQRVAYLALWAAVDERRKRGADAC